MRVFAAATVLSVHTPGRPATTLRTAHRAAFQYVPKDGMIYVRSRAISSRCNDNWDYFGAEEIKKAYRTFVGKPVFVNHVNDDHKRMRGLIIDAALHEDRNPDGSPDTWAEVLMEIDGRKFPKLARALVNGWIDRTSMGCFVTGTLVTRADGVQVPIETIALGDEVLTHTGKSEPVTYVMTRDYSGPVYDIHSYGRATPLVMTPEHPVWVRPSRMTRSQAKRRGVAQDITVCSCGRDLRSYLSLTAHVREAARRSFEGVHEVVTPENKPRWVEAKDVTVGDWVLTPRSTAVTNPGTYTEARLLGYYVAEGNLCWDRSRFTDRPVGVEWTFHEDELDYLAEVQELTQQLGYTLTGPYRRDTSKGVTVRVNSPALAAQLLALGGQHAWGKRLAPEVMGWAPEHQRALLTAYWNGDGHYEGHRVEAATVSEQLAQQLHVLAVRCDIPMTPPVRQHSPSAAILDHRPKWSMQAVLTPLLTSEGMERDSSVVVDEAGAWRRVTKISIKHYEGQVHNFDVEGDDSYVAADVAVHNCDVQLSRCSACGTEATTPLEYCEHIPGKKGSRILVKLPDGRREAKLVYEECVGLSFFENSLLVEPPADPTAFFLGNVELGPGLGHLAKMASITPQPLRLDKPVERLPVAEATHWQMLSANVALLRDSARIWGLLSQATRREAPTRDDPYATTTHCEGPGCRKSVRTNSANHEMNWEFGNLDNDEKHHDFCSPRCALSHMDKHPESWDHTGEDPIKPTDDTRHDMYRNVIRRESALLPLQYIEPAWLQALAYGETKAPRTVDTLRDEACPICGNDTAYAGRECQICGYILPIKAFGDPDVDKAKELDQLKQTVDDQLLAADPSRAGADFEDQAATGDDSAPPTLGCPGCGAEFEPEPPQTSDAPGTTPQAGPAEGDVCPECNEGELQPVPQPNAETPVQEPEDDELDQDKDQLPDDEEDGAEDDDPASRKRKTSKYRNARRLEGDPNAMNGLQAMAAQQQLIDAQSAQLRALLQQNTHQATQIQRLTAAVATLARAGGVELEGKVRVAMIRKRADEQNPAQPIPEPAPQPATQSTQEAKTPEAFADVTAPGMVPGTTQDVAADAVTTAYTPGQDIAAAPFRNLVDVTAPVEGTQGPRPINETRTEVDVRAGNPMNPQVAFPIGGPFTQQQRTTGSTQGGESQRFVASLRLARLQIQAGIAEGEDLAIAQRIASDGNRTDELIAHEIATLSSVRTAKQATDQSPPRGLVPRAAGLTRTVPLVPAMASAGGGSADGGSDDDLNDIFLPDL